MAIPPLNTDIDPIGIPGIPAVDCQEELSAEAWERLKEALTDGRMVTRNGKAMDMKASDYIKVVQWLAMQRTKKPKNLPPPRDAIIRATDGSDERDE